MTGWEKKKLIALDSSFNRLTSTGMNRDRAGESSSSVTGWSDFAQNVKNNFVWLRLFVTYSKTLCQLLRLCWKIYGLCRPTLKNMTRSKMEVMVYLYFRFLSPVTTLLIFCGSWSGWWCCVHATHITIDNFTAVKTSNLVSQYWYFHQLFRPGLHYMQTNNFVCNTMITNSLETLCLKPQKQTFLF